MIIKNNTKVVLGDTLRVLLKQKIELEVGDEHVFIGITKHLILKNVNWLLDHAFPSHTFKHLDAPFNGRIISDETSVRVQVLGELPW
jgi:hypothetical protein